MSDRKRNVSENNESCVFATFVLTRVKSWQMTITTRVLLTLHWLEQRCTHKPLIQALVFERCNFKGVDPVVSVCLSHLRNRSFANVQLCAEQGNVRSVG